ncbi:MAG: NUDIX hydrolase [Alphaproteobacteria bacterium]|nr:NUDIX hydrolase [Rhodospirillales bacterium]MCW9045734.1 NUDIX hydrolase [Alphaproteobacteria bacterium]
MSREYPSAPIVGVGAVVFKDEQVLLIKRGNPPRHGEWSLPGGAQDLGETYQETAKREIFEETNISINVLKIIDVVDSILKDDEGRIQFHYTLIDVVALWDSGEVSPNDDALEAKWFNLDQIANLDLWNETIRIITEGHKLKNIHLQAQYS